MRILAIHADRIYYKVRRKTPMAEEIDRKEDEMRDCVVVFSCVERMDEIDPNKVIEGAKYEIEDVMKKLKASNIMIYPFAHLANTLSSPPTALKILTRLEGQLKEIGFIVKRAPFGWYKEFELKDKGHPLSELSKTICPYEGTDCDFLCPYCQNPIKVKDVSDSEDRHVTRN